MTHYKILLYIFLSAIISNPNQAMESNLASGSELTQPIGTNSSILSKTRSWGVSSPEHQCEWHALENNRAIYFFDSQELKSYFFYGDQTTDDFKIFFKEGILKKQEEEKENAVAMQEVLDILMKEQKRYLDLSSQGWISKTSDTTCQEMADALLSHNSLMFWTGAGISKAAGVPTLVDLHKSLNLESMPCMHAVTNESMQTLKADLFQENQRSSVEKVMFDFLDSLQLTKEPTKAHKALAEIIFHLRKQGKTAKFVSSNLDGLHQIDEENKLDDEIESAPSILSENNIENDMSLFKKPENFKLIDRLTGQEFIPDILIMFGLRNDDYHFARILATKLSSSDKIPQIWVVNQTQPEFLLQRPNLNSGQYEMVPGYWVSTDLQEFLPELAKRLGMH